MTGLEKIVSQILDDANKEAETILAKAAAQSAAILKKAQEDCGKMEEDCSRRSEETKKAYMERIHSSAQLKKRQAILLAKQQVISDMLDKAYDRLLNMEDSQYFSLVEKMVDRFALAKSGEICFSNKDLGRMPADFEEKIRKAAARRGGELSLSKKSCPIDGGFILVYGGVEENCSFKALLNAQRDELSDRIHSLLFP